MPPMAVGTHPVLRYLRTLNEAEATRRMPDQELLRRFVDRHDEAAFRALVCRHGPAVHRVCLQILGSAHDAEDAWQATFLVLAQRAAAVGPLESVGGWLYGVASRVGRKMRTGSARRRARENRRAERPAADPLAELGLREAQEILNRELTRLPEKYQLPLILCCLEGLTRDEAAQHLGLPVATLKSRLERARELLRLRLKRHGLPFSGALLASALCRPRAVAALPPTLVDPTVKAATLIAAGRAATAVVSAEVVALARGVTRTMYLNQFKIATAVLVGLALLLGLAVSDSRTHAQAGADNEAGKPTLAAQRGGEPASGDKLAWREILTRKHEHAITAIACSSDWTAAGDEGGNLFAWDTKTGKNRQALCKGGKHIDRLQFTADGKDLYGNGKDLYVIWGGRRGIARYTVKDKKLEGGFGFGGGDSDGEATGYLGVSADAEICLEFFREGRAVNLRRNAYEFKMGKFFVRPNFDPNHFETVEYEAKVSHALVSAGDKWLAVATKDGTLHIHDRTSPLRAGAESHPQEMHTLAAGKQGVVITDVQFSVDGQRIAVARDDALAKVYDTARGEEVATLKGHSGIIFAVAFSPDGKKVVTGGDDNTARLWDAETGKVLAVLEGHADSVLSVAFTPDGDGVVTGSADKTVKVWKLAK
jgi:RNA polymerase sigma factor (sigma-70 family)